MSVDNHNVNRRQLLLGVVVLLGGAAALTRFARKSGGEALQSGPALGADQFALLEEFVDVMIPATDTPGARAAGVPAFIRDMLAEWASAKTRDELLGVLAGIDRLAWAKFGASFVELQPERRQQLVVSYDAERIGVSDPAYARFKELVLLGYYLSEAGATQELRYELIPGAWRSCVPFSEIGRASPV